MDGDFKELRIGCYNIIICRKIIWVMNGNGNSRAWAKIPDRQHVSISGIGQETRGGDGAHGSNTHFYPNSRLLEL